MTRQRQGTSVRLDECVLGVLETAVVDERLCPSNGEIAMEVMKRGIGRVATTTIPGVLQRLVREGAITIRYYSRHARQVEIHEGRYAGRSTATPPNKREPVDVIDAAERRKRDKAPRW